MIKQSAFDLFVSHSQLIVYDASREEPYNDWTLRHVELGFAWRQGSVSFSTLEEAGLHEIHIVGATDPCALAADAVRVIEVPFEASSQGRIEIASITDSASKPFIPGLYQLRFEIMGRIGDAKPKIRLSFVPCCSPVFRLARADAALTPGDRLLLTACPA